MQSQKLSQKQFSNRYAVLSATALILGLSLYGCGENKVSQCNKVVTVANKAKTLTVPSDMMGFIQLSENIDQIRVEAQAIAVQDSNLKELQTQLLSMYGDVSFALKAQAKAAETKDTIALEKANQQLGTAASKESDIVDRLNTLCTK